MDQGRRRELCEARQRLRNGAATQTANDKLRDRYEAARAKNEKQAKVLEERTAQARRAWRESINGLATVSRAKDMLVAEFRKDAERLEARRAPKRVIGEIGRLRRTENALTSAVRDGKDYVKRLRKTGALREELGEVVKIQTAKESELAQLRAKIDETASKLERLEAARDDLWHAFLAEFDEEETAGVTEATAIA